MILFPILVNNFFTDKSVCRLISGVIRSATHGSVFNLLLVPLPSKFFCKFQYFIQCISFAFMQCYPVVINISNSFAELYPSKDTKYLYNSCIKLLILINSIDVNLSLPLIHIHTHI